jgi:hypothetical protein
MMCRWTSLANRDRRCDRYNGLECSGANAGGLGGFGRVMRMIVAMGMFYEAISLRQISQT